MDRDSFENTMELLEYISNLKTPKEFVETKGNVEYVKVEYMKYLLNKFFRPWDWTILKSETIYINGMPVYEKVHGRLSYTDLEDDTILVDMIAAHRIQYNKNGNLVDLGNDAKAANTDTFKKTCNFALNISDDIYRSQFKLGEDEYEDLEKLRQDGGFGDITKEKLLELVDELKFNKKNFAREISGAKFRLRHNKSN